MIQINIEKAIESTKEKIRAWRVEEFKKNDINIQNGLIDNIDISPFVERRDFLRSLPETCESKKLDELKEMIEQYKI